MRLHPSPRLERCLPPIAWAVLAQLIALALTAAFGRMAAVSDAAIGLPGLLMMQGGLAALISYALRLPGWWLPIQFGFVPALVLASRIDISPGWYLGGFTLLSLLFWSTFRTQVPLYLSRRRVWRALDALLPRTPGLRFVDLGAGVGGLVAWLARRRPDGEFIGVECAPLPGAVATLRTLGLPNAYSHRGDLWREDLSRYNAVFAYLSPVPMPALWEKARREMRPGTLFISYRFIVPGVAPSNIIELNDLGRTRLYVWCM